MTSLTQRQALEHKKRKSLYVFKASSGFKMTRKNGRLNLPFFLFKDHFYFPDFPLFHLKITDLKSNLFPLY